MSLKVPIDPAKGMNVMDDFVNSIQADINAGRSTSGGSLPVFAGYGLGSFLAKSFSTVAPYIGKAMTGAVKGLSESSGESLGDKLLDAGKGALKGSVCGSGLTRNQARGRPDLML